MTLTGESTKIPFNRPCLTGNELVYLSDAVKQGHAAGDGPYTRKCQQMLTQTLGAASVLLTTSCTHALEMAALLLDVGPSDEVIIPSFTFVSTANAFVLRGASPVFVDIRPDTLNLDERLIEERCTRRTKAIVPVHYGGVACEMDAILATAAARGLAVVEDNAHGLFGSYRGRPLGTFGCLATQSFHETKNISCGEGGALIVNDSAMVERAEVIREKGTDRARFYRGQVDKYTWTDVGSSYVISDLLAAYLLAQLEASQAILAQRGRIWNSYRAHLADWARDNGVQLPVVPADCKQPYHMFYILLPNLVCRQRLIAYLNAQGITSVFHYQPLHLSPMGRRFGGRAGDCPVTESVADRLLRLPLYNSLTDAQVARIVEAIHAFSV